ncbi:MAG TPA: hypothetical protein VKV39_12655 [Candidatus Sulfotelmatobacter sp.]|nr:hypothetical protein [Candidatus Sulfotelmatobacter sp.]
MAIHLDQSSNGGWKNLYVAALLEGDRNKMLVLIERADSAIVSRMRELLDAPANFAEEQEDLDDAAYALHALRTCLEIHGGFADAA